MAVAAAAAATAAVDRKKSLFRQALTALRYAVAAGVTVVVFMTAVYAFVVVARTDDLYISVVNSYISMDLKGQQQQQPELSFTLSVDNRSGRVRFYYTDIQCELVVNDSSAHPSTSTFVFPDMVVAQDSVLRIGPAPEEAYFNNTNNNIDSIFRSNETLIGNLTLTGSLTVGVYSAYNKTSVRTKYYCSPVTVGNNVSASASSGDTFCLTDEDKQSAAMIQPYVGTRL